MKIGVIKTDTSICLLAALAMMLALNILNTQELPDYHAYREMYIASDGYSWKYQALLSVFKVSKSINLSYDSFRNLNIIISSIIFYKIALTQFYLIKKNFKFVFLFSVIFLVVLMFFLEFMLVRLRAGYSILTFLAFAYIAYGHDLKRVKNFLSSIFFVVLSFCFHLETATVLFVFFVFPLIFFHLKFPITQRYALLFLCTLFLWSIIYAVSIYYSSSERIWWASDLNVYRFIAISPVALLIIIIQFFSAKRYTYECRHLTFTAHHSNFFSVGFFSSALVICVLYLSGFLGFSGETTVRIVTLYSTIGIWFLMNSRFNISNIFFAYTLLINSIFFYNTLYL